MLRAGYKDGGSTFDLRGGMEVDSNGCVGSSPAICIGPGAIRSVAGNLAVSTGMLVERTFMTSKGAVDFAAEAVVDGGRLILKDSVLYGRSEQALTGMSRDIYRGFETLKTWAASQGFQSLEISGTRAANSTSANPGSTWSKIWDLTK